MFSKIKRFLKLESDSSEEVYYDALDNSQTFSVKVNGSLFSESCAVSIKCEHSEFDQAICSFDNGFEIRLLSNKGEYVEGKWKGSQLKQLKSLQFFHPSNDKLIYLRMQKSGYLLIVDGEDFLARVQLHQLEEIDFSRNFSKVKRDIVERLNIIDIIKDEMYNTLTTVYRNWKQSWERISLELAENFQDSEDAYQLTLILARQGRLSNEQLLHSICCNKYISNVIKEASQCLLVQEAAMDARRVALHIDRSMKALNLAFDLEQILQVALQNYRKVLMERYYRLTPVFAADTLKDHIGNVDDSLLLYISFDDMLLFDELSTLVRLEILLDFVCSCWDTYFRKVNDKFCFHKFLLGGDLSLSDISFTHPMYYQLFKSFQELIEEICNRANIQARELLLQNNGQWELAASIDWTQYVVLNHIIERQYRFIFIVMKHFQPGLYSRTPTFKHLFRVLKNIEYTQFIKFENSKFVCEYKRTAENCLVWMSVLDDALAEVLTMEHAEIYAPVLDGYIYLMQATEENDYEVFRVVTHNMIRFVTLTHTYLSKGVVLSVDREILLQQVESIKYVSSTGGVKDLQDLVDVLIDYWVTRESIVEKLPEKFPYEPFTSDLKNVTEMVLKLAHTALSIRGEPQWLVRYFRSFVEFLEDLDSVRFDWYIKGFCDMPEVQMINESKNSCKVKDPEEFAKKCDSIPRHYIIEIVQDLLNIAHTALTKEQWTHEVKLVGGSELLSAMKKSLVYLKEQPDYISFHSFKEESTLPFKAALESSRSQDDFMTRIIVLADSFWYIRKQDELDIDKALDLFKAENNTQESAVLRSCYDTYIQKFNGYIEEAMAMAEEDRGSFIASEVTKKLEPVSFGVWSGQFKSKALVECLAGVAAAWSVLASVDIVKARKSLKPHCMQVLCLMRLLGVDNPSEGVDHHLAQVLTGQGKSLVLGLLAVLLALTGHRVRVVCYSAYLADRDKKDLLSLFQLFQVCDHISYGTFNEMANELCNYEVDGAFISWRKLVDDLIVHGRKLYDCSVKRRDVSKTVLLIDEVDVFFSKEFYGTTLNTCTLINMQAIADIQEKIWDIVKSNNLDVGNVLNVIDLFIKSKINSKVKSFQELNHFLIKDQKYTLLDKKNETISLKEYTNASLFKEHLEQMVVEAIQVSLGTENDWFINRYTINQRGIYHTEKTVNYGYMLIVCGWISYAKIPEEYPLILGVTGTLSTLHDHEKRAVVEHYNIRKNSLMPSFFGHSNLRFISDRGVACVDSEEEWLRSICARATAIVDARRSVLVFFETEVELEAFREQGRRYFDRLRVLTVNTEAKELERGVEESGVARTVTLLTRHLGRGVDFKSSSTVERSGGVHVIQTFFSLDVKEEAQIKGRTARKDNSGSYELLLCRQHLRHLGLLGDKEGDTEVKYETLDRARSAIVFKCGLDTDKKLKNSEAAHRMTLDYFRSFIGKEK